VSEFEGITTDFNGYPIVTKTVRIEGFSDKEVVPSFYSDAEITDSLK